MRRTSFVIATLLALCTSLTALAAEGTTYGKGITLEQALPIKTLLASPDQYNGKQVRIDGVVTAVCEKRGCWMMVSDPESGEGVRIKVEDGVIVFPMTAKGHKASAEGVFKVKELTEEQKAAMKEKHAQEHKTAEDCPHKGEPGHDCAKHTKEANAEGESSPCKEMHNSIYFVEGTGAIVYP